MRGTGGVLARLDAAAPESACGPGGADGSAAPEDAAPGLDPRQVLDASPLAVVAVDTTGMVQEWNPAAEQLLGWSSDERIGRPLPPLLVGHALDVPRLLRRVRRTPLLSARCRCRRRNGRSLDLEVSIAATRDEGGAHTGMVALLVDVTARSRRERQLLHRAQHDALTGLPNRSLLTERLGETLAAARSTGRQTGVLLIDLDKFKEVNDTLGHAYGDQLLAQVGPRLLSMALRQNDILARLSGDEFAVILPNLRQPQDARAVAERVLRALHAPFHLGGDTSLDIAASVGIAVSPDHGDEAAQLLQRADSAMYEAKDRAAGVVVYEPERENNAPIRLQLLGELRRALKRDELVLHYQPKVDLATGQLRGVEALVRWRHPSRGFLGPGAFIPVAETTGLIQQLTLKVLDMALAQVSSWRLQGLDVPVAVNLSARCLHDETLPKRVGAALEHYELTADFLRLEITESAIMADPEKALAVLRELSGMGVGLALDDFGTGYSSMSYLRDLPVDELKIDRSFVVELASQKDDRMLVHSAVDLGHNLGLIVVAEGVEDAATGTVLRDLGCDVAQGYHYARPMAPDQLLAWLDGDPARRA